jgi:hypothetical protein
MQLTAGIPRLLSAELAPQGAAATGTQCRAGRLPCGTTAHRPASRRAGRATGRATHDGPGLTLSFGRDRRPGRAAQGAANQRAGVAANLLADGGPGATTQC